MYKMTENDTPGIWGTFLLATALIRLSRKKIMITPHSNRYSMVGKTEIGKHFDFCLLIHFKLLSLPPTRD